MARRITVLCSVLLFAAAAFGAEQQERTRPDQPYAREAAQQREVAPLLYALPALRTHDVSVLELRIVQGKFQLIREKVMLPADVPDGAAVDVLYTHPGELERLRAIETETPGKLRFIALIDGRVVTDEPFAAIEAQGKTLSLEAAVGQVQEIESHPTPKPRVRASSKEPYCAEHCDVTLNSCLEWCDPRGDCSFCYTQYNDCWSQCPDIPDPCYEPKSESDYTVTTLYAAHSTSGSACYIWHWTLWYKQYQHATYHRVVHCDNSYTDTLTSATYTDGYCYVNDHTSCSPKSCCAPSPQC